MDEVTDMQMTWQGWLFLALGWGGVGALLCCTFWRILKIESRKHKKS
ncbi:MAG: hypothetical protein QHI48_05225 [Bacteroidota bacterium]|nr:hypothetical protein [Bacteroidota bacterium]